MNQNNKVTRKQLCYWIKETYGVQSFPKAFYQRLRQIREGTDPNVATPISSGELLDMWQGELDNLNRNANRKNLKGYSRVLYDISVLLNKYNEYCRCR